MRSSSIFHERKAFLKFAGMRPMRRRSPAVENASFRQDIGARADRGHAPRLQQGSLHKRDQARRCRDRSGAAADDDRIIVAVVERFGFDAHAKRTAYRAPRLRQEMDIVERLTGRQVGELEHRRGSETHQLKAGATI
jgi:hypothetical protein